MLSIGRRRLSAVVGLGLLAGVIVWLWPRDVPLPAPVPAVPVATPTSVPFTGWFLDERDHSLADHVLQLSRPGERPTEWTVEVRAVTGPDGSFSFAAASLGLKLLEAVGPGEGDMPELRSEGAGSDVVLTGYERAEGRLLLKLDPSGFVEACVIGPRHPRFWVRGVAAGDVRGGIAAVLYDPSTTRESQFEAMGRRASGPVTNGHRLRLLLPYYVRNSDAVFLAGGDEVSQTRLRVKLPGFFQVERTVSGSAFIEDIGIVEFERAPRLMIVMVDGGRELEPVHACVVVTELSDDLPARETRYDLFRADAKGGPLLHECDRPAGHFELSISIDGYVDWTGSGDFVAADEPQRIDVAMQPAP